jgi:hypothetical protein
MVSLDHVKYRYCVTSCEESVDNVSANEATAANDKVDIFCGRRHGCAVNGGISYDQLHILMYDTKSANEFATALWQLEKSELKFCSYGFETTYHVDSSGIPVYECSTGEYVRWQ